MAGVGDAVVDGLELLVDDQGEEGAAADLPVDHLAHRSEGRVGDARLLHEVVQDEVQVLEGLPEQGEPRLGGLLTHELLDVGVDDVVVEDHRYTHYSLKKYRKSIV